MKTHGKKHMAAAKKRMLDTGYPLRQAPQIATS